MISRTVDFKTDERVIDKNISCLGEILGSYGDKYEDGCLVECSAL
jgi:hypothetical protein